MKAEEIENENETTNEEGMSGEEIYLKLTLGI
mgnify:FL=1